MSYENPTTTTHTVKAGSLITAATLLSVMGPRGLTGVLRSIAAVNTTGVTVAASSVIVGITGTLAKFGTLPVPISAINAGTNAATLTAADTNLIAANSVVIISSGGGATAGAADITVVIDWFK